MDLKHVPDVPQLVNELLIDALRAEGSTFDLFAKSVLDYTNSLTSGGKELQRDVFETLCIYRLLATGKYTDVWRVGATDRHQMPQALEKVLKIPAGNMGISLVAEMVNDGNTAYAAVQCNFGIEFDQMWGEIGKFIALCSLTSLASKIPWAEQIILTDLEYQWPDCLQPENTTLIGVGQLRSTPAEVWIGILKLSDRFASQGVHRPANRNVRQPPANRGVHQPPANRGVRQPPVTRPAVRRPRAKPDFLPVTRQHEAAVLPVAQPVVRPPSPPADSPAKSSRAWEHQVYSEPEEPGNASESRADGPKPKRKVPVRRVPRSASIDPQPTPANTGEIAIPLGRRVVLLNFDEFDEINGLYAARARHQDYARDLYREKNELPQLPPRDPTRLETFEVGAAKEIVTRDGSVSILRDMRVVLLSNKEFNRINDLYRGRANKRNYLNNRNERLRGVELSPPQQPRRLNEHEVVDAVKIIPRKEL